MPLELANFPVNDVSFGPRTYWEGGVLHLDRAELSALVREDPYVDSVEIQIARPGESARIANVRDILEPKAKVGGTAVAYPGISGRPVDTVGQGRTHRLAGFTVMACARMPETRVDGSRFWGRTVRHQFIDMSGPGAITPYASLFNLCLELKTKKQLDPDTWNRAIQAAMLRVCDRLAQATVRIEPPELEVIDLTPKPDLPGFVFIPCLASPEHRFGNTSSLGTAVYGVTRLTPPWLLQPTEMLDGAVCGTYGANFTWPLTNTIPFHMARRHGRDFNFLGCVVVRTNWESQSDKQLMANRAVQLAQTVGAQGAIVTTNVRGQRFVETILTLQACERAGINVVLLTQEEDDENGTASPLLIPAPEAVAVVSTGTGGVAGPFPAVRNVIGALGDDVWFGEQPSIHGRYGVSHAEDIYGFTRLSCIDY